MNESYIDKFKLIDSKIITEWTYQYQDVRKIQIDDVFNLIYHDMIYYIDSNYCLSLFDIKYDNLYGYQIIENMIADIGLGNINYIKRSKINDKLKNIINDKINQW